MMVASSAPPNVAPGLYGTNGRIHWPTFFARTAVRGLILWPVVSFIGGVSGARGVATAIAGGAAYTGVELAWDATGVLAAATDPALPGCQPASVNGLDDGFTSYPGVIDTFSP